MECSMPSGECIEARKLLRPAGRTPKQEPSIGAANTTQHGQTNKCRLNLWTQWSVIMTIEMALVDMVRTKNVV